MAKVHYSKSASTDLAANAEYIARDKPDVAYRWIEKIEATCELLAANPEMGQPRMTRSGGRCRSFVSGNYVLFFRPVADGVEIVRIVRGERDLDRI
ncbi:MAG: type II toxin-antitoxin system RelE/ParE family toxin [Planctomycetota bacterium]|nr:MAG: type II toxin-antitoxin system RelE/ParE family toxin [Planctomycetota bacterium]REJ88989.1 MAG: type II toxin-antitoxin system RelE/ParE family toxin [Planctomycetota bacterium]REK31237.1 MAG: type II toxin-antitoxin system RelE/ParE family toxin [Planctomycetota bacterium]REK43575.1 MAG: type II toxin-antitoxin system RelE/ParE family toxin [Planctomycetota bacterium]